jgi:hypothetical protein
MYNLCIIMGATFARVFNLFANGCGCSTVGAGQQPFDLTGYTASMQIRPYPLSSTLYYDVAAAGDITLGGTAGTIAITIPASVTETFTWFNGVYDLFLTDSSGNAYRTLSGTVSVTPTVTQ